MGVVSQFMHNPSEDHMGAVVRILRYLKSSPGKGLMFSKNVHLNIEGYTDANWAGNILDRKSTSSYFTFVGGNLVTWRSKKQKVVALSSAEAEFRGMAKGLCELLWLRSLLTEVGFPPDSTMNLLCDNKAAINISHNPIQHDRTKHVEVDRHVIKQNLEEQIIQFPFVKSEDQLQENDQGRNRARSSDGEVLQAEPVLNDQLGEFCYLNSKQTMQQATTSTIVVEQEVQSDEFDTLNKDTAVAQAGFMVGQNQIQMQEQSTRPLERSTLMTSGFEVESLLPTVRYEDGIQSAESNLSIDMNELLDFLDTSLDFKCSGPCD
ncbi:unnamed protein product [Camellia sinensis]